MKLLHTAAPAAMLLVLAACSDLPMTPAPAAPERALVDLGASASFNEQTTKCDWNLGETATCMFSLSDVQNLPQGGKVEVISSIHFSGDYNCVSTKNGRIRKGAGGRYNDGSARASQEFPSASGIAGQVMIDPMMGQLPSTISCPRGTEPVIATITDNNGWMFRAYAKDAMGNQQLLHLYSNLPMNVSSQLALVR